MEETHVSLDTLLANARDDVAQYPLDDPRHELALRTLERLTALSSQTLADERRGRPSPDALVNAGASVASVGIIVAAERMMVIASKALPFALRFVR